MLSPKIRSLLQRWRPPADAGEGDTASSHRRNRSIVTFFASSLAARGVGIVVQLLLVPVALKQLGNEAFGLWMTLTGLVAMLTVADFGIGLGAQNRIAEATGSGDPARARRVFFTSLVFLSAVAAGLMVLAGAASWFVDWPALLKLREPTAVEGARPSALFLALACSASIPLGLGQRLAFGLQMGWLINIANIVNGLAVLGAVLAVGAMGGGLLAFVEANFVPMLVVNSAVLIILLSRLGWWRSGGAPGFDRAELRGLLEIGGLFLVQQICAMTLFWLPSVVLSATLGAAAVTPFNLGQRLFNLLAIPQNAFLLPIWPAYADAKARGDWPWVERTLRRTLWATVGITVLPMAVATFVARPVLRLWVGPAAELPSQTLVVLLFALNALVVFQQPFGFFLAGMSEVRRMTVYSVVTVLAALGLMLLLAPRLGAEGVTLGLIAALGVCTLPGCIWETRRLLRRVRTELAPVLPGACLAAPPAA